jgi:chemotaxis protein MotB
MKRRDHPYHGGAWKVAYADFVTAMMALFIVLWILATKTETQAAVAAYFRHPTIFKTGSGFISPEGMQEYERAVQRLRATSSGETGEGAAAAQAAQQQGPITPEEMAARGVLTRSAQDLETALNTTPDLRDLRDQVSIEFTPEGMRIQLADLSSMPLFALGSTQPTALANELLATVARVLAPLPNSVLIEGHTDSRPFSGQQDYSNWELSGDRANAARRILEAAGVAPSRIVSVVGHADRQPLLPNDPADEHNRRISVIVCY